MNVKCEDCNKVFTLTEEEERNLKEFAEKGKHFMVSRCPLCHNMLMLHPLALTGITNEIPVIEDNRLFYCPMPCCVGYIEYDKEANIFNCAECGSTWKNKEEIFKSISEIIKKYSHRKNVYKKLKNGWKSIEIGNVPDDYFSKVQNKEKM
ncbi:hypothetical protein ACYULU_13110 [Breznakiellaceae bacterium SP9]